MCVWGGLEWFMGCVYWGFDPAFTVMTLCKYLYIMITGVCVWGGGEECGCTSKKADREKNEEKVTKPKKINQNDHNAVYK